MARKKPIELIIIFIALDKCVMIVQTSINTTDTSGHQAVDHVPHPEHPCTPAPSVVIRS